MLHHLGVRGQCPVDAQVSANPPLAARITINIISMLSGLRSVLSFEMTIAEWIGTAVMLAAPYLVIGLFWSLTHNWHLGSILLWPVLLVSAVCTA